MQIFVFGNPDLAMDALPMRLLPALRVAFPTVSFETLDPNEEWLVPKHMLIIDTVVGIEEITVFDGLDHFSTAPRITCHDFDAYANLLLLKKLGNISGATIIGIPPQTDEQTALDTLKKLLKTELEKKR